MKWADKQWTISDYLLIATAIFGFIGSAFAIYVVSVTNDVRSGLNDEWQRKEMIEFNGRMLNLNERMRDGFKEVKQDIKESNEQNLSKQEFNRFERNYDQRWVEINQDMQYLRTLKRFDVPPQPVYRQQEVEPKIPK